MEYQALYRKYRPQTFDDVIGQGHVTTTLAREVADGRVAHAYLFTGPRGTGKTTTARILAKALNCVNRGADGAPCNVCPSCVAITEGSSLDVLELDAASHNSVDDIRDIKVSVTTVASSATSKRVFVLDEAHMLSKAAGNALLKTLEEPPEHVHFVLATTEPYKLLDTIRSRSQRFDFHPVPIEELAGHLSLISDREGYKTDPAALIAISRHAGGSVRDSLSLLEQVAALGAGSVDVAGVRRALGLADSEAFMRLVEAVAEQDAKAALELVAELAADGVDLRRFVAESVSFFRGAFLAHYAPNLAEISDEPADVYESWRKAAQLVSAADVLRAVDLLGDALVRLREGREERLMTELALIKLTRPETSSDAEALLSRVERIERRLGKPDPVPAPGAAASNPRAFGQSGCPRHRSWRRRPLCLRPRSKSGNGEVEKAPEPAGTGMPRPSMSPSSSCRRSGPVCLDPCETCWGPDAGLSSERLYPPRSKAMSSSSRCPTDFISSHCRRTTRSQPSSPPGPATCSAGPSGSDSGSGKALPTVPAEQTIDMDQLEERPAGSTDPTSLLASELGAEVVDE